ncbi:hemolysin D [Adhaeribacter aerolatus]|uniref:Hemolysin D n=1 Tax=Adhaeribacter aerolatus TaxID=670289 RepID=A0A512AVX7_9BACT|nr:efflux RND transporter periplasmic adaptor subunit [Adhaeribacter aerolatus]GEO03879.1 hemolysin D [Adhaeribacter aerolatus]
MHTRLHLLPVIFLFLFLAACGGDNEKTNAPPTNAVKDYPVLKISPHSITLNSDYPATIEGQQDIQIRPMIDGYLGRIHVDEGATVKKGQVLFTINAPQYEQEVRTAQANVKIAQANVNAAQMEVNKVRPLVEKNIISQFELESAQFTLQARQAALAQANAALVNARTNMSYTRVTSPVNGIVGSFPYKIGSLVSSNTPEPLTTVSNIGNIYAYFSINEKQALEFSRNTKGATTQERLATTPPVSLVLANGTVYPEKGRIETTSGSINTETGSVRVRATFPNPGSYIRSGSSGSVRIPITLDSAIVIPQKATYEIQGKKFVYLVGDSNTVRSQEVAVMENDDGRNFVVEEGLQIGNKIILEGVATLREGAPIRPRTVNADSVAHAHSR